MRLKPGVPSVHKNLGVLLADKGRLDEAVAHLRQALELRPVDADAHYTLGEALLRRGDFEPAAQEFQTVLRIDPQYSNARQMLEAAKNKLAP